MPTHIQWTDETWNFVNGCTRVSAGCTNCYIEWQPPMRKAGIKFDHPGIGGTTGVRLFPARIRQPLSWRDPKRVFVNSMGDTFHDDVPTELIARAFAVMVATPKHQFQVLTKRHARMRSLLSSTAFWAAVSVELGALWKVSPPAPLVRVPEWIWVGVSVEDQTAADLRIPVLLRTPAVTRWLSCEPLLGPVDLTAHLNGGFGTVFPGAGNVDWVVTGGETKLGPGARPMHPGWARSLRDQCTAAGIPFFYKQTGDWAPVDDSGPQGWRQRLETDWEVRADGYTWPMVEPHGAEDGTEVLMRRVGKKAAGRALDGREWNEYPANLIGAVA